MVASRIVVVLVTLTVAHACAGMTVASGQTAGEAMLDLYVGESQEPYDNRAPEGGELGDWETIGEDSLAITWDDVPLRPFDWVRHFGFRHSSTHGRSTGRGIPLKGSSWRNRPYHVDWFFGPLLSDDLIENQISQSNVALGGLRIGWDFDYYWGLEWRFGWAEPDAQFYSVTSSSSRGRYFVSDIDLVYYPWGDSKVRPYTLLGLGAARVGYHDASNVGQNEVLVSMPFGGGVQFHQTPWMVWRLEVLDNLAFGSGTVATMNNVSLTVGMELRMGARPSSSYWPWRSSRSIW